MKIPLPTNKTEGEIVATADKSERQSVFEDCINFKSQNINEGKVVSDTDVHFFSLFSAFLAS